MEFYTEIMQYNIRTKVTTLLDTQLISMEGKEQLHYYLFLNRCNTLVHLMYNHVNSDHKCAVASVCLFATSLKISHRQLKSWNTSVIYQKRYTQNPGLSRSSILSHLPQRRIAPPNKKLL